MLVNYDRSATEGQQLKWLAQLSILSMDAAVQRRDHNLMDLYRVSAQSVDAAIQ